MTYYIGKTVETQDARYFYGLRRDDDTGFLILDKINLDKGTDTLELVDLSAVEGNLPEFENLQEGVDFFDGRTVDHELQYDGLNYEQYKWSSDNLYYYVDGSGQLVVRINKPYNYSEGVTTVLAPSEFLRGSPVDLGSVAISNPLENRNILDLGLVTDTEATVTALDAGVIV
jgi:hypothetical protein